MTIDLRTGEAYEPRREDYITKLCGTPLGGECPTWHEFLRRVTDENLALQHYLQRVAGYCMTGETYEHVLFFLYGGGANGKSVFVNTLLGVWGDYAAVAPMDTLLETKNERHPTDLAFLRGVRLVVAQEVDKGRRWAESKIKTMTGGDPITARFMRQDFFTFEPQFKLMIAGNHKPSLRSVDEASRRRFHLIPFNVTIPAAERDPHLFEKLKLEWGGILQWAVDGCLEYQRLGLAPPQVVLDATDQYLAEEDATQRWLDECCAVDPSYKVRKSEAYDSWKHWAAAAGEYSGSLKALTAALEKRGIASTREGGTGARLYQGFALNP